MECKTNINHFLRSSLLGQDYTIQSWSWLYTW